MKNLMDYCNITVNRNFLMKEKHKFLVLLQEKLLIKQFMINY